ncbi:autotransporter outer membrane beta-barrel domain-containing protein [Ancylobacter sonchi]|uniref:autotransporter outer membrane beta-barrel domain-containing protein n=1 Tax=Ancylobacter sonchi TaxID=1937790 RepID=UPI0028B11688|nr:autotransporter outer membrane beta-barrel domain-containing protein [Ancylobacter sonchi]
MSCTTCLPASCRQAIRHLRRVVDLRRYSDWRPPRLGRADRHGSHEGGLSGQIYGGTAGWDRELADSPPLMGLAVNLSRTDLTASQYGASVTNAYGGVALYAMERFGPAYVAVSGSFGYSHADFDRDFFDLGLGLSTSTGFDSTVLAGRIEAGYSFDLPGMAAKITPFAAFQSMHLWQGGADECFPGYGAGLSHDEVPITALPVFLGVQLESFWKLQGGAVLTPFLKLAWMRDFSPDQDVPCSFAELPDISFSDSALPTVSDAADIHAGVHICAGSNTTFSLGFDGQLGSGYSVLGGSGTLRVRW